MKGLKVYYSQDIEISFNNVWGNISEDYGGIDPGHGDISEDPLFVDPENFNFHLQPGSPCINTGDPKLRDPDISRSDMGAFWFDQGFIRIVETIR